MTLNVAGLQLKLPDDAAPQPTLLIMLTAYFALTEALEGDAAHRKAVEYVALLNTAIQQADPLLQFTEFCVQMWGDGRLPDDLKAELGDESSWTDRERLLVSRFKELRSDYLIATGMAGERGELMEELKKSMREGKWRTDKILDEAGDDLYYWCVQLARQSISPHEVMAHTRAKLIARRGEPDPNIVPPWR